MHTIPKGQVILLRADKVEIAERISFNTLDELIGICSILRKDI